MRTSTWENIGMDISNSINMEDALNKANLNFNVCKSPLYTQFGESSIEIPNSCATIREDKGEILGVVGKDYSVCQNVDAFDFVNYISDELKFEKAGMTYTGMVYIITKLPKVKILDDGFVPYLIFQNSFNGRYSIRATISPLRIVCQNQIALAFRNSNNTITIKHNNEMYNKLEEAKKTFLETKNYMVEFTKQAESLASKKFSFDEFKKFVYDFLPIKEDMTDIQKSRIELSRTNLINAYDINDNQNFKGTAWGAINAMSDYLTHRTPNRNTDKTMDNQFLMVTLNPEALQMLYNRVAQGV